MSFAPATSERFAAVVDSDIAEIVARDLPWERLAGKSVLVTGAGGFLGGYLVRTLLGLSVHRKVSAPVRVLALVRDLRRAEQRFSDLAACPDLRLRRWDLNDIALPDVEDSRYVLHAASQASPRFYGTDPVGTLLPNTVGTAALLEALRRGGQAEGFLFVSSSEVYGQTVGEGPVPEDRYGHLDPVAVRACYGESKRMGEAMCVAWHGQHRIPAYIVRPFHTYGPGLLPQDGRVFADFVFDVVRGQNITMRSDGSARRAFCYVADAIAGFFTVLLRGAPAVPYNVAHPQGELSVLELATLLVNLVPEKKLRVERVGQVASRPAYLASTVDRMLPDVSRLAALGWQARVDPAEGFGRMVHALGP